MTQFYCPLCSKNIGNAMDVLGDPMQVWEIHMSAHIKSAENEIWQYLLENMHDLPAELQQLEGCRVETIKQMNIQRLRLKNMIENEVL